MTPEHANLTDQPNIEALNSLLDEERAALLEGNLERIAEMFPQKEALIEDLSQKPPADVAAVQALGGKVRRNQLLLDGALEGIQAAMLRMTALREIRAGLETYGPNGKKHRIATDNFSSVEKRA